MLERELFGELGKFIQLVLEGKISGEVLCELRLRFTAPNAEDRPKRAGPVQHVPQETLPAAPPGQSRPVPPPQLKARLVRPGQERPEPPGGWTREKKTLAILSTEEIAHAVAQAKLHGKLGEDTTCADVDPLREE